MYCKKCGNKLDDKAKFCSECGEKVEGQTDNKVIKMTCEDCSGIMEYDEDANVVACPFCGSKRIVLAGDEVQIERIRAKRDNKSEEMQYEFEKYKIEAAREDDKHETKMIFIALIVSFSVLVLMAIIFNIIF